MAYGYTGGVSKGNSKCKVPETGVFLVCLRDREEASETRLWQMKERVVENKVKGMES